MVRCRRYEDVYQAGRRIGCAELRNSRKDRRQADRTSEYLGERVQVRFPMAPKGPYQKRRHKRLNRAPRNWSNCGKGEYWVVDGREVWCHPDDLAKLK